MLQPKITLAHLSAFFLSAYKCYDPTSHKLYHSRHVEFIEDVFPYNATSTTTYSLPTADAFLPSSPTTTPTPIRPLQGLSPTVPLDTQFSTATSTPTESTSADLVTPSPTSAASSPSAPSPSQDATTPNDHFSPSPPPSVRSTPFPPPKNRKRNPK
ncbi:hypothetical protein LXL04_027048 [Taraxacum kok-saghyz]